MVKTKQSKLSHKTPHKVDLSPLANQQIQLRDLRILNSMCSIPLPGKENNIPELQQTVGVKSRTEKEPPMVVLEILFTLIGDFADGREGLRIQVRYGLAYSIKSLEGITTDQINAFGNIVGVNNAWPYWREFVQSMINRMNLPPLTLPLLRPDQLKFTTVQSPGEKKSKKRAHKKKHQ